MMVSPAMPSTAWLVDVAYVVKAASVRFKLDYLRARHFLTRRFGPIESFLFNGYDESFGIPPGLGAFYEAMRHEGFGVRLHPMDGTPGQRHRQRRVDVDIAAHLVWQASRPEIQRVVLTSGDQDFVPAVTLASQTLATPIVLFAYRLHVHRELVDAVDDSIVMDDYEGDLARR
jgi:uncharacterized LabA/DUF88 family protein